MSYIILMISVNILTIDQTTIMKDYAIAGPYLSIVSIFTGMIFSDDGINFSELAFNTSKCS